MPAISQFVESTKFQIRDLYYPYLLMYILKIFMLSGFEICKFVFKHLVLLFINIIMDGENFNKKNPYFVYLIFSLHF